MKKTLFILTTLILLCGCRTKTNEDTTPILTVSIEPMRYFVEQLAGDNFQVQSLVPGGSAPETYEPSSRQMVNMANSVAFIRVGDIPFETNWLPRMKQNAPQMEIFDASKGVELIEGVSNCGHAHGGLDPHIWSSPRNAMIISKNITEALCQLDPANSSFYEKRLDEVLQNLRNLDETIKITLSSTPHKLFVIYHPALGYFANDYGWTQLAIEDGGKEPSPARLRDLIDTCRAYNVNTILVQKEFATQNAEIIAKEIGAKLVTINPLSYKWEQELRNIINNIAHE